MSDLKETKSLVAKLMAEENLDVQHGNYRTAMMDLENRRLCLPVYKWMDGPVYDLMCSHEVGHARYTPVDGWHQTPSDRGKGYKSFVNVVEDARIEKKIKRKFPGAGKQMIEGYYKLLEEDFFGVKGVNLDELPLIDRINLYTKAGYQININFSNEERVYVEMVERTETFSDVLDVVEKLWNYAKEHESNTDFEHYTNSEGSYDEQNDEEFDEQNDEEFGDLFDDIENSTDQDDENNSDSTDQDDENNSDSTDQDDENNSDSTEDDDIVSELSKRKLNGIEGGFGSPDDEIEPISHTDIQWQNRQDDLIECKDTVPLEYLYLKQPKANLKEIVVDYKRILADIENQTAIGGGAFYYGRVTTENTGWNQGGLASEILNKEWFQFRKKHQKVINYLAKEFEMKKAAGQHSRSLISKTGIIDSGNLFKYCYSEDIFKKMTLLPDGKNHGLLLFIDWSGSMSKHIYETIEQCLVLAAFCEKVQISFEVYMFSDVYANDRGKDYWNEDLDSSNNTITNAEDNVLYIEHFRLLNILSSRMSKRDFQKGAKYFLGLGLGICSKYIRSYSDEGSLKTPNGYSLGGTPLDEAILTAATMVPEFKKSSGAEIVNTIFLTDGESRPAHTYLKRLKEGEATEENVGKLRVRNFNPVRKNGYRRTYSNGARVFIKAENGMQIDIGSGDTSDYLEFLSKVTNTNTIGFYLAPRKWFNKNTRWNLGQDNNNIEEDFRKGSVAISNCDGYDERYFINVDKMLGLEDSNLEGLSDNATKGQIKTAFKKMVNNKLTNRVILNRMINLIAA